MFNRERLVEFLQQDSPHRDNAVSWYDLDGAVHCFVDPQHESFLQQIRQLIDPHPEAVLAKMALTKAASSLSETTSRYIFIDWRDHFVRLQIPLDEQGNEVNIALVN